MPATLTPSSGTLSTSQTFTWSNGAGPTKYQLQLGTAGAGSANLYNSGAITATSATVSIPATGVTVYATLWQLINNAWTTTNYTFTEPGTTTPATLTPSSGTLSTSQTFTWSNGAGPAEYQLKLGTAGAGSTNLYNSGAITATSATVSIPAAGVTVYATLWQLIDNAWTKTNYTFTEPGTTTPATLTPTSGTLSTSQTFTWSNGAGPAEYQLQLGTAGAGSANLYNSGAITATSATVSIPYAGAKVYATLWQLIDGAWTKTNYTFTEPMLGTLTPSSGTLSTSQTFTWSNAAGPTKYQLQLGTTGAGSANLYNSGAITATSATVSIPATGVTVYAMLWQLINNAWTTTNYTFTEPGTTTPATLTPSSGTLSTSQTFTWSNGAGPAEYQLKLGTAGAGSTNLYNSGAITATSATVSIPAAGVTVYAALWQLIDNAWTKTNYTFTEPGTTTPATLTPSSGTLSTSQTFTWRNGAGPAEYQLQLGTAGAGSANLYNSGAITATSATVSLPYAGATVYATLWQLIDGAWTKTNYTFTETTVPPYEVILTWDAPTDSSDPVAGYNVYRTIIGSSTYELLNSSLYATTAYTDTTVESGTSYIYYVESVDGEGSESAPSNSFAISVP